MKDAAHFLKIIVFFILVSFYMVEESSRNYYSFRHYAIAEVLLPPENFDETQKNLNSCGVILVEIKADESLYLNSQKVGTIENPEHLQAILKEILDLRREKYFYEHRKANLREALWKGEVVVIKAPLSIKYEKVARITFAVKEAGAKTVSLQIDDLPQ